MEVIELDGKQYLKASDAARKSGYTSDYIGQLCRADAIDARMVGRSWYVNLDELTKHRAEKKRSSREKARQYVRKAVAERQYVQSNAYTSPVTDTQTYGDDDTELFPNPSKDTESAPEQVAPREESVYKSESDQTLVSEDETESPDENEVGSRGSVINTATPPPVDSGDSVPIRQVSQVDRQHKKQEESSADLSKRVPLPQNSAQKKIFGQSTGARTSKQSNATEGNFKPSSTVSSQQYAHAPTAALTLALLAILALVGVAMPLLSAEWSYALDQTDGATTWTANSTYGIQLETLNID